MARKPIPQKLTSNFTAPKRARKRTSSTDKAIQGLQEIAQKLDQTSTREDDNEFDCFGKSVAASLKKLPESIALESMEYIQSYLVRQRLSNTQQISQPSSSASSSTYENAANPCSNHSNHDDNTQQDQFDLFAQKNNAAVQPYSSIYYNNNTDINLRSNPQQEQSDLLSQAINASLHDDDY